MFGYGETFSHFRFRKTKTELQFAVQGIIAGFMLYRHIFPSSLLKSSIFSGVGILSALSKLLGIPS